MSYIGNPPVVQTNRLIYEEVVTVAGKTDFYPPGGYTVGANFLDVELNGNDLGSADFTATDGALVRLAVGAGIGDLVRIIAYGVSSLSNATPANGSVTQGKMGANVAGNGPAYSAYKAVNQTVNNGAYTKIIFPTEEFDTNSNYDAANSKFQPSVAGYYWVTAQLAYGPGAALEQALMIFKNGAASKRLADFITSDGRAIGGSALIYMNGSTDYLEAYLYTSVTMPITGGDASLTYFQATLARAA